MDNIKICNNKKAFFEYEILEKHIAGIKLLGSEVKSIRGGKVSIPESYCYIKDDELFIKGMHVAEFTGGNKHYNHNPLRDKKLLMNKKEIVKLNESLGQKGLTIVPLDVFISKNGFVKITIGLGKGKHLYDKSKAIKLRDLDRDSKRDIN